jgi:hypothetical protein
MTTEELLLHFIKAAKKQKKCIESGDLPHSIWCNYQTDRGNGEGKCNCGISDILTALKLYEKEYFL